MTASAARAIAASLPNTDWDNTGAIRAAVDPLFSLLTDQPRTLLALLDGIPADARLASMCEQYDFMTKLVLLDEPTSGIRVRLHRYREGFFDRPHNHRWSFAARIVRGSYRHRIYGSDDAFTEATDPSTLTPICERIEGPGATYVLHHTAVHTVQAQADTISVLVRGPAAKDRFLIHDNAAGRFFWVTGAAQETPETRAEKQMTVDNLTETIEQVRHLLLATANAR
jgi:hypothetical protein